MDSTIWLYIALAIIVVGLIIAGIGVGVLVSGMKEPMKKMKGAADDLKERMNKLQLETTSLQHHANELKEDMAQKSQKVSTVVNAAQGAKNSAIDLNSTVRSITAGIAARVDRDRENAAQVEQWSNTAIGLLDFWEYQKASKNSSSSRRHPASLPVDKRR